MGRKRTTALIVTAASILSGGLCGTAAAVQLQLKLDKGKTYYQRTTTDQRFTQTVMGQEQVINQSVGTGLKLDVLDMDRQGNMRIRHTFIWSRFKAADPTETMVDYDSAKPATQATGAEPFAAILGQSYVVKVSPKGQVLDVNGVDEMREAVLKKLPPGRESGPAMSVLDPYLKKDSVKDATASLLSVYPEKPVEVGESWTAKMALTLGFPMIIEAKWTLQKREAGVAVIATTASIRSNPDAPPMDVQGMKVRFNVSGPADGTVRVREATGLIALDESRSLLKGLIKVAAPAGEAAMDIPVVFDTTSKTEMSDKMWQPLAQ